MRAVQDSVCVGLLFAVFLAVVFECFGVPFTARWIFMWVAISTGAGAGAVLISRRRG